MEQHTEKNLLKATKEDRLYDYIAEHYYEMSNYELKEVLLAVLSVLYDHGIKTTPEVVDELKSRGYGEE